MNTFNAFAIYNNNLSKHWTAESVAVNFRIMSPLHMRIETENQISKSIMAAGAILNF